MRKITTILFDLDGTILFTLPDLASSVNHALEKYGFPVHTEEEIKTYIGNGIGVLIRKALPAGTADDVWRRVRDEQREYYVWHCTDKTEYVPGMRKLLAELKDKGYILGMVSNKDNRAAERVIEHYYPGVFGFCMGETEGIPRKPDPAGPLHALQILGDRKPSETIYVGDSIVDYNTAVNTGCIPVLVNYGYGSAEVLKAAGCSHVAGSSEELLKEIESITGEIK